MIKILETVGKFNGDPEDKRDLAQDEYSDGQYLLPKFSGTQGLIIKKSLKEMQESYMKTLRRIRNVNYNHLDVKASQWHENIARYRQNVKELTIFAENVMRTSFTQVQSSVIESCSVLGAFEHLASR